MSESKVDDLGVGLLDADPLVAARLAFGQPATAITLPATLLRQRLSSPSTDLQMPRDSIEAWGASAPARATSSRRSSRLSNAADSTVHYLGGTRRRRSKAAISSIVDSTCILSSSLLR